MNFFEKIINNSKYLEDFIVRFTYHSNAIEGSTLTYAETYAILYNDNSFKINKLPREIYEAINHKKALELLFAKLNDNLNEEFIKKLNEQINQNILDTIGYHKVSVMIRGSELLPPPPEKVNTLMNYFVYNYNNMVSDNIFVKIAQFHIEFEEIHPFEDGNGRTGRLLINYELLKNDIMPIVIPKEERVKYFEYLRNKDIDGLAKWLEELSLKEEERFKLIEN
jgi:Fic family protein